MRSLVVLLLLTLSLLANVVVIGPVSLPIHQLTQTEIQHLFMGKTETINDIQLIPKNRENRVLYKEFCETILGKSTHQIRSYWARMIFTGQQKPPAQIDREKLESELHSTPPIITYALSQEVPQGWKILFSMR